MTPVCPLCAAKAGTLFHQDNKRSYFKCAQCQLVHVPPAQRLSATEEKAQYDLHENNVQDQRYREFLSRLFQPLCARLPAGARGLDFGSGPGPALALMFTEAGFDMRIYDPFYAPDSGVLNGQYDFICSTEVVEHLHHPGLVMQQLFALLPSGGWLGIMTKLVRDAQAFRTWHYKNDPTHVCFWSRDTFAWLAHSFRCTLEFIGDDVILLQKQHASLVSD